MNWFQRRSNWVAVVVLFSGMVLIGYLSYYVDNSYRTYTLELDNEKLVYTFECPESYEESRLLNKKWDNAEKMVLERYRWFRLESVIAVYFQDKSIFPSFSDMTRIEKNRAVLFHNLADVFTSGNVTISSPDMRFTSMHGYPAVRTTAVVSEPEEQPSRGAVEIVWFERSDYICVISIFHYGETEFQPSRIFEHLLDTFAIADRPIQLDLYLAV